MTVETWLARMRPLAERARTTFARPSARRALAVAKVLLIAAIGAFIAFRLSRVGWSTVLANIPSDPLFYLLFFARYSLMPLSEVAIYGRLWVRNMWPHFAVFWRKRALNMSFLEASGETYLALWASRRLAMPLGTAAAAVKDVNVLLIASANMMTVLFVVWAATTGAFARAGVSADVQVWLWAFAGVFAALTGAIWILRGRVLHVDDGAALQVSAVHFVRLALVAGIVCLQWSRAIPGAPLETWFAFFALYFCLTRVPFLPAKEIVFVSVGLLLADHVPAAEGAVAGMLVTWAAMTEIANAAVYLGTTWLDIGGKANVADDGRHDDQAGTRSG